MSSTTPGSARWSAGCKRVVRGDDLLCYLLGLALDTDSVECADIFNDLLTGKKVTPKELHRQFLKADTSNTGVIDDEVLEKVLKKLCGGDATPDILGDVKAFFDPTNSRVIDRHHVVALAGACSA